MRKLPVILLFLVLLSACKLDPVKDAWEYYEDWRNENNAWLDLQLAKTDEQGRPYYEKVVPEYDRNACIYIHYFNDRNATSGNLSPMATSTCDVKYKMELYNGTAIDSTYLSKSPADSLMRVVHLRLPHSADGNERGRLLRHYHPLPTRLYKRWKRSYTALFPPPLFHEISGYSGI